MDRDPLTGVDDRAREARDRLRFQVDRHLDLGAARAAVDAAAARQRRNRARVAAAGFVVLLVGAWFALAAGRADVDDTDPDRDEIVAPEPDGADAATGIAVGAPYDGKDSARLPVVAEPQSGLHDGDVVRVRGRGFRPDEQVGIVHCATEADIQGSAIDACDTTVGVYVAASSDGTVDAEVPVHASINTPSTGPVDCTSGPERCLIGVGAMADYDRSGGTYIDFADAPPFDEPHMTVTPDGPVAPGQAIEVAISSYVAGRPVRLQQCVGDRCRTLLDGKATAEGTFVATVLVDDPIVDDRGTVPCDGACELRVTGIGEPGASSMPFPAPHPLRFDADAPVAVPEAPLPPPSTPSASSTSSTSSTTAPQATTSSTTEAPPDASSTTVPARDDGAPPAP